MSLKKVSPRPMLRERAKRQPGGGAARSGTVPAMFASRPPGAAKRGAAPNRPMVKYSGKPDPGRIWDGGTPKKRA